MAKHVEVIRECDVTLAATGEHVSDGVVTRTIATDGTGGYREVDVTKKLSDELDAFLDRFLRVSRPGSKPAASKPAARSQQPSGKKNSDRNSVIRGWARKQPRLAALLPERGRIPAFILNAFYAEHDDLERPPAHQVRLSVVPDLPATPKPPPAKSAAGKAPAAVKFREASAPAAPVGGHADRTATARAIGRWARSDESPEFTADELKTFFPPRSVTDKLRTWIERDPRRAKRVWGFYLEDDGKGGTKVRLAAGAAATA